MKLEITCFNYKNYTFREIDSKASHYFLIIKTFVKSIYYIISCAIRKYILNNIVRSYFVATTKIFVLVKKLNKYAFVKASYYAMILC